MAPDSIVLHYTGMCDAASAVDRLCDPASQVSSHYVVTEGGAILGLVDEDRRAWHAGRSVWHGETDLNSASIGVEIVNGGHDYGLPAFPDAQIDAVVALCQDVMWRHAIPARRFLAHSDIAPGRKQDPGERFPWRRLALAGIGLWPEAADVPVSADTGFSAAQVRADLRTIGYGLDEIGDSDAGMATVVCAFQRRYRPDLCDGVVDRETMTLIAAVRALHESDRQEAARNPYRSSS